jgi:hypothetical protein
VLAEAPPCELLLADEEPPAVPLVLSAALPVFRLV